MIRIDRSEGRFRREWEEKEEKEREEEGSRRVVVQSRSVSPSRSLVSKTKCVSTERKGVFCEIIQTRELLSYVRRLLGPKVNRKI